MFVRLMGVVGVGADEQSVLPVPGVVVAGVLARLALSPARVIGSEEIADALWDDPPPTARNAIQVAVSKLRVLVGREAIASAAGGYRLADALARVDLVEIEQTTAAAQRAAADGRWQEALAATLMVHALDRGPALGALRSEWADRWRDRSADTLHTAALVRARALTAHARTEEAVALLRDLTDARPLDERAPVQLMPLLATLGRAPDALAVYDALRRRLADELGADPGAEAQEAFAELLAVRPAGAVVENPTVRLPQPSGPTFGRDSDVETALASLADGHRLVAIVGPGGVGKTRVAIRVAQTHGERTGSSVWFVDLTEAGSADAVGAVLDASIGSGSRGYAEALRVGAHLIVLDNAEHVLDEVAVRAGDLLGRGDVSVLVTTRAPLRAGEERVVWLGPLRADGVDSPAARLALARAQSWITPSPEDGMALAELAARLDGMPLAIELVIPALRWMSPQRLLGDVIAQLESATGVDPRPARQASVVSAIDWSVRSASPPSRAALAALGVFTGDFSLDAAAEVLASMADGQDDRRTLAELVDLSLAQRIPGPGGIRLRILEAVRLGGRAHPLVGEPDAQAEYAYAHHYLQRVRDAVDTVSGSDAVLIDLYRHDDHHVARALEWAWQHDRDAARDVIGHVLYYWYAVVRDEPLRHWAQRSAEMAQEVSAAAGRRAIALFSWDGTGARERATQQRESVLASLGLVDRVWTMRWVKTEADRLRRAGQLDDAVALRAAGPVPETSNDIASQANFDSLVAAARGDFRGALDGLEKLIATGLWAQSPTGLCYVLSNAGYFALVLGDLARAGELLTEASAVAVATGFRDEIVMTGINSAWLALAHDDAVSALHAALGAADALGDVEDPDFAAEIALVAALAAEEAVPSAAPGLVACFRGSIDDDPADVFDAWIAPQALALLERHRALVGEDRDPPSLVETLEDAVALVLRK